MAAVLDDVLWQAVLARWAVVGTPRSAMLVLDSTVVLRYGLKQAGAEKGYNPKKPGRPSHHPLVAFLAEADDAREEAVRPVDAAGAVAPRLR